MSVLPFLAPSKPETVAQKMERLAGVIADKALQDDAVLSTQMDALKILVAWKVGIGRSKNKDDDEPTEGGTLADMRRAVEQAENEE